MEGPRRLLPWVPSAVAAAVAGFALSTFAWTQDPMLLVFAAIGGLLAVAAHPRRGCGRRAEPGVLVRVRCQACRALNEESARFCAQRGRPT